MLPDLSSPRADLDAFARRSTWARRSTCGPRRCSRTSAHPVRTWTRSPGARRGPGARRAARLDVRTSRAAVPQLTPCGLGRVRQALDAGQALDVRRGSTCGPHALPDLSSPRADLDAFARRSRRSMGRCCSRRRRRASRRRNCASWNRRLQRHPLRSGPAGDVPSPLRHDRN